VAPSGYRPENLAVYGDEALRIAEEISWLPGQAFAYCQQAVSCASTGDYGDAIRAAERALEISTSIGHTQWQTFSHYDLASIYLDLGVRGQSLEHFQRASELAASINSRHWIFISNADYARALVRWGDLAAAEAILDEYLRPDLPMIYLGHRSMWLAKVELLLAQAQHEPALRLLEQLGETTRTVGFLELRSIPYLALLRGQALVGQGRWDEAAPDIEACLSQSRQLGLRPLESMALAAQAELLLAAGREDSARERASAALAIIDELAATINDAAVRHMYLISEPVERLRQHAQTGAF
jgi:tetratricopeptide (TPR) repeat protein